MMRNLQANETNLVRGREATRLDDDLDDRGNKRKLKAKKVSDFAVRQTLRESTRLKKGRREGMGL